MNTPLSQASAGSFVPDRERSLHEHSHGVCWTAIFAGAVGASVFSLILLLLGTGIGFSAISPWADHGVSAATVGVSTIVWMTLVQILASVLGGYLAGRLRSKWVSVHDHEAYFRDTAHGFLAWGVATLVTATLLSSAVSTVVGAGVKAGSAVAGGAATVAGAGIAGVAGSAASSSEGNGGMNYFTDAMFRQSAVQTSSPANSGGAINTSSEVAQIFSTSLKNGSLTQADSTYLAQLVSQRTGLSTDDAQKRVNDAFAQAQQTIHDSKTQAQAASDTARKASAGLALWLVVSLLIGAFTASWAATLGGRYRDRLELSTH